MSAIFQNFKNSEGILKLFVVKCDNISTVQIIKMFELQCFQLIRSDK